MAPQRELSAAVREFYGDDILDRLNSRTAITVNSLWMYADSQYLYVEDTDSKEKFVLHRGRSTNAKEMDQALFLLAFLRPELQAYSKKVRFVWPFSDLNTTALAWCARP